MEVFLTKISNHVSLRLVSTLYVGKAMRRLSLRSGSALNVGK